jgi:hypothetical protein
MHGNHRDVCRAGHPRTPENGLQDNAASIDRIDSTKGYLPGNVQVISYRANILKQNATLHELKCLVRHMESITPRQQVQNNVILSPC